MRSIGVTLAAAAAAASMAATAASTPEHQDRSTTLAQISSVRSETLGCERNAQIPLSPMSSTPLTHAGPKYRAWVWNRWSSKLTICREILDRTLQATADWGTAVSIVQRAYPGSSWWLLSCSSSEGGHGGWVPNTAGSGAGGWMQYMEGTFEHDFGEALADLRERGFRVPASVHSWYQPLGQAVAAGWAYAHDRPYGKWVGGGC